MKWIRQTRAFGSAPADMLRYFDLQGPLTLLPEAALLKPERTPAPETEDAWFVHYRVEYNSKKAGHRPFTIHRRHLLNHPFASEAAGVVAPSRDDSDDGATAAVASRVVSEFLGAAACWETAVSKEQGRGNTRKYL